MAGYIEHFKLKAPPFSASPDPAFAYATREHQLAVAKIQYTVEEQQGMFLLRGEIGAGKTTVSHLMMNAWREDPSLIVAHVTNPNVRTQSQFLKLILQHYGQEQPRLLSDKWDALGAYLAGNYQAKKTTVLVLDEAQAISAENMETLTHISNLQTQKHKLIQLILLAQPNIERKLTYKPALRERIAHGSTLNPLTFDDATNLLSHRVTVAGGSFPTIFPDPLTHRRIYNTTKGIPRRMCMLCDNAMLNAFALGQSFVDDEAISAAITDLSFKRWEEGRTKPTGKNPVKDGLK